ncbi:MAG: hypothetical protein M3680_01930, partial [Myxococcota bacterium]|nr:hypothetical protein [Myxococcota bacterium]
MVWWCWLVLLAGCTFTARPGVPSDGDVEQLDGLVDAPADAVDDRCFGSGAFYLCLPAVPAGTFTTTGNMTVITTSCDSAAEQQLVLGGQPVCVIAADTITINAAHSIGVVGDLPLVLVAVTSLSIAGTLDVASSRGNTGPNADPADCSRAGIDGGTSVLGGGGGAGGSFGTPGAVGGVGNSTAGTPTPRGTPAPAVPAPVTKLRGGCPGGRGGEGTTSAAPGPGGGALYLVSRGELRISGLVNASGGGAAGGLIAKGGGGGGGSGGMIVM